MIACDILLCYLQSFLRNVHTELNSVLKTMLQILFPSAEEVKPSEPEKPMLPLKKQVKYIFFLLLGNK